MTLLLSYVTPWFVLQASDRLVTAKAGEGRQSLPYDIASNKTVFAVFRDGMCTISYTGDAYVVGVPTDVWLANILIGRPVTTPATWAYNSLRLPNQWTLSRALWSLQRAMDRQLNRRRSLKLQIVGWRQRGRRLIPFGLDIARSRGTGATFDGNLRRLPWAECISDAGALIDTAAAFRHVYAAGAGYRGPARAFADIKAMAMVEFIRGVSAVNPTVGADVVTVALMRDLQIDIAFHPALPTRRGYAPWQIRPEGFLAPTIFSGSVEYTREYVSLHLGPPDQQGVFASLTHQPRPPAPRS